MLPFPESPASQGGCLPEAFLLFTTGGLPYSWKDYCTASLTARSGHFSALPACCRSYNLKTEKSLNIWARLISGSIFGHLWSSGIHSPPCWSLLCWYDCCWPETFFFFYPYSVLFSNKRNSETFKFCEISNLSIMHLLCAPLQPLPPPWAGNQCWFPTPGYQALEASRGQLCAGTRPSSANKEQLTHCSQSSSQCKTLWARHKLPPLSSGTLTL